jgi:hypothetical protein
MGIHTYPIDDADPPAVGQYSQPIILKVPETIRSPGDHFHLVVEALGDAVGFAKSPHSHNSVDLHPRLTQGLH